MCEKVKRPRIKTAKMQLVASSNKLKNIVAKRLTYNVYVRTGVFVNTILFHEIV